MKFSKFSKFLKLMVVISVLTVIELSSRVHELVTDHPKLALQNFEGLISVNRFAIVLFNPYPPEFEIDQVEELFDIFKAISRENRYRSGDLTFIAINLHKHPELGKRFRVKPITIHPAKGEYSIDLKDQGAQTTVVLYKDDVPIKQNDTAVQLKSSFTKSELKEFIEKYLKKQIDKTIERKKERMVVETTYVDDYSYPNYSYPSYQPYFYYSPYYYRPYWGSGFGFGVGFGRGGYGYGGWW